jgi:hypothetical protein
VNVTSIASDNVALDTMTLAACVGMLTKNLVLGGSLQKLGSFFLDSGFGFGNKLGSVELLRVDLQNKIKKW